MHAEGNEISGKITTQREITKQREVQIDVNKNASQISINREIEVKNYTQSSSKLQLLSIGIYCII